MNDDFDKTFRRGFWAVVALNFAWLVALVAVAYFAIKALSG